jgi:hypothetical protein
VDGEARFAEEKPEREDGAGEDLQATDRAQRTAALGRSPDTDTERYEQRVVDQPLLRVQHPFRWCVGQMPLADGVGDTAVALPCRAASSCPPTYANAGRGPRRLVLPHLGRPTDPALDNCELPTYGGVGREHSEYLL